MILQFRFSLSKTSKKLKHWIEIFNYLDTIKTLIQKVFLLFTPVPFLGLKSFLNFDFCLFIFLHFQVLHVQIYVKSNFPDGTH